eukprot:317749_1
MCKPLLATINEHEEIHAQTPHTCLSISQALSPLKPNLNVNAQIFVPSTIKPSTTKPQKNLNIYIKKEKFVPEYKPRAHLNIYIGKHITRNVLQSIQEFFHNDTSKLYYYLDGTTAIQIITQQMYIFQKSNNEKLTIINLDLHKKISNELLYAVVVPNDKDKIQRCNNASDKWLWKLDACLTADEIRDKYQIECINLPESSRIGCNGLYKQIEELENKFNINQDILLNMKWNRMKNIQQIGASQKFKKNHHKKRIAHLKPWYWKKCVNKSWNKFDVLPMVVYGNEYGVDKYWIELIKFIYIESMRTYIGVSFRYNSNKNGNMFWSVQAIYLDKGDMYNKYRLCGFEESNDYILRLNTSITGIKWLN